MKLREVGKPALSVPAWQSRFARRERAQIAADFIGTDGLILS